MRTRERTSLRDESKKSYLVARSGSSSSLSRRIIVNGFHFVGKRHRAARRKSRADSMVETPEERNGGGWCRLMCARDPGTWHRCHLLFLSAAAHQQYSPLTISASHTTPCTATLRPRSNYRERRPVFTRTGSSTLISRLPFTI